MHREEITLCNHKLSLFQAEKADCPLIVFHSFSDEGEAVYQELRKQNAPECHFLSIAIHDWQREFWSFCDKNGCRGLWGFRLLYRSKCTEIFEREIHLAC